MSIIGKVGRNEFEGRLLAFGLHAVLIAGAILMLAPFVIMLANSVKSNVDLREFDIVPKYFHDDAWLFKKFMISKYNGSNDILLANTKTATAAADVSFTPDNPSKAAAGDFTLFIKETSPGPEFHSAGMIQEDGSIPLMTRRFASWLKERYGSGDAGLKKMNADLGTAFASWDTVSARREERMSRRYADYSSPFGQKFMEFKESQTPLHLRCYMDADGWFMDFLRRKVDRSLPELNAALGTDWKNWGQIVAPESRPSHLPRLAKWWDTFARDEVNLDYVGISPEGAPAYRAFLRARYKGDIAALNKAHGSDWKSFDEVQPVDGAPATGVRRADWNNFIGESAPASCLRLKSLSQRYRKWLAAKYPDAEALNKIYAKGCKSFSDVPLPAAAPTGNIAFEADWQAFANNLGEDRIDLTRNSAPDYKEFVWKVHQGNLATLSADYGADISKKDDIPAYSSYPASANENARLDYANAVRSDALKTLRRIKSPDSLKVRWTDFLKGRHADITALNKAYGLLLDSPANAPVPIKEWEWAQFKANKWSIFKEFLLRNYIIVFTTLFSNGQAALNTAIYCLLSIIAALTVNPMAAYALSRFKPPSSYRIILFLMLTLAFPEMVIAIPQFLLIKDLGMMNTFFALILPAAASGYSIFLLKGFFDSIPKELFEAAQMEGADEWHMFWHIAMSLSKPVLAVVALGAFVAAYGNFMLAFLVCQKPEMWTMMVYLYQLQQYASPAIGFAALIIAAIPTLLVFALCQNLIVNGIVVPAEE